MALGDPFLHGLFHGRPDAHAIQNGLYDEVWIVECSWSPRMDGDGFPALFELPTVYTTAEAKADTSMVLQIAWISWDGVGLEVLRRADHGETQIFADADGNHVSLDKFADLNAGVIFLSYEIDWVVRRSNVENYLRILLCELRQPGQEYEIGRRA